MKFAKTTAFILIQLIICGMILEIVCYFFLLNSSNPLYRARRILQYDSEMGWFQKPDLNTSFEKAPVMTDNKGLRIHSRETLPKEALKFLTLGPSSAFGWGVKNEETYSALVNSQLKTQGLNASGIGHSLIQGEIIWNKYFSQDDYHFAHILIAYGVNDLDKFRFFDSEPINDKTFFQAAPLGLKMDKLHLPSNFATTLSLVIRELAHKNNCEQLMKSVQRVSWEDYSNSLSQLVEKMKKKNSYPIIIGTPFYLKNKNPEYTLPKIEAAYAEVNSLARQGLCKAAHEKLKIAKSLEPDHINEQVIIFNTKLKSWALAHNVIFIDTFLLLQSSNTRENYYDPVHPSKIGHKKIAQQIINSLRK